MAGSALSAAYYSMFTKHERERQLFYRKQLESQRSRGLVRLDSAIQVILLIIMVLVLICPCMCVCVCVCVCGLCLKCSANGWWARYTLPLAPKHPFISNLRIRFTPLTHSPPPVMHQLIVICSYVASRVLSREFEEAIDALQRAGVARGLAQAVWGNSILLTVPNLPVASIVDTDLLAGTERGEGWVWML